MPTTQSNSLVQEMATEIVRISQVLVVPYETVRFTIDNCATELQLVKTTCGRGWRVDSVVFPYDAMRQAARAFLLEVAAIARTQATVDHENKFDICFGPEERKVKVLRVYKHWTNEPKDGLKNILHLTKIMAEPPLYIG